MIGLNGVKEIAETVLKFSPIVAGALGSPAAGIVLSLLSKEFNVAPQDLNGAIASNGDSATKIKEFEIEHSDELAKLSSNNYSTEVDDRKDARATEVAIEKAGKTDWVLSTIAIMVTVGFFILCLVNYFFDIKDDHVLIMLIGQSSAGFGLVLAYFFGSSQKQSN